MEKLACALAGGLLGAVYIFPGQAARAAGEGLAMWAASLVPALGPAMALCLYFCTHSGEKTWLFPVAAILCGSPGGAGLMQECGLKGRAAAHAAAVTGVMSPMFFLGFLSDGLGNRWAALTVYFAHLAAAWLTGLCIKGESGMRKGIAPLSFSQCIGRSIQALMTVGYLVMLGAVAAEMVSAAFPGLPSGAAAVVQCLMEVTGGVKRLCEMKGPYQLPLICAAVCFGGGSILMQNSVFWRQSGIGIKRLAAIRVLHGLMGFVLCFFLQNLLFIG